MGLLDRITKKTYQDTWSEVSRERFDAETIDAVEAAEVVASEWGISVKLTLIDGQVAYFPISKEVKDACIGDTVDVSKCFLVTLKRGDKTCEKILF
jgi:hypothetical protein